MQIEIGEIVSGKIDRPIGYSHPEYPEMIYPVNYGYVEGVFAEDGKEQDVYVLGSEKSLESFIGKVIAIYKRYDDIEDKWIVSVDDTCYSDEEILQAIHFQAENKDCLDSSFVIRAVQDGDIIYPRDETETETIEEDW